MRFGKISAGLLCAAGAVVVFLIAYNVICNPGWGSIVSTLGGLALILLVPLTFVLGVLGIIFDKRKWLSIVTTVISGGLVAFWFTMIVISVVIQIR